MMLKIAPTAGAMTKQALYRQGQPKGAAKNAAAAAAEKEQQAREEAATKAASQGLQRVLAPRRAQNIEIMLVGFPCVFTCRTVELLASVFSHRFVPLICSRRPPATAVTTTWVGQA